MARRKEEEDTDPYRLVCSEAVRSQRQGRERERESVWEESEAEDG